MQKVRAEAGFVAVALVLLGVNFYLVYQNRDLRARLYQSENSYTRPPDTLLPPLEGLDRNQQPVVFDYEGTSQVTAILVFSPYCGICTENWPAWEALIAELRPLNVRIIAIDTTAEADEEYYLSRDLKGVAILKELDPKSYVAYRFRMVPQTILVNAEGRLMNSWVGALTAQELESIRALVVSEKMPSTGGPPYEAQ